MGVSKCAFRSQAAYKSRADPPRGRHLSKTPTTHPRNAYSVQGYDRCQLPAVKADKLLKEHSDCANEPSSKLASFRNTSSFRATSAQSTRLIRLSLLARTLLAELPATSIAKYCGNVTQWLEMPVRHVSIANRKNTGQEEALWRRPSFSLGKRLLTACEPD